MGNSQTKPTQPVSSPTQSTHHPSKNIPKNQPKTHNLRVTPTEMAQIQNNHAAIEKLCRLSPSPSAAEIQANLDEFFTKVSPDVYKQIMFGQQNKTNFLNPLLRLTRTKQNEKDGKAITEEELLQIVERNTMLVPSCQAQQALYQTLGLYLRRPNSLSLNHRGVKILLERLKDNITFDVLYSVYCTYEDYIQHISGPTTEEHAAIMETIIEFIKSNLPKLSDFNNDPNKPTKLQINPAPTPDFSLSIYNLCLIGSKINNRVQVPPMFFMIKAKVDNLCLRKALKYACESYNYNFYRPIGSHDVVPISSELPYAPHCIFHAPAVGGFSDGTKSINRSILNLDNEIVQTSFAQSRCGSTFTYLSQSQIFSLDLVIYLLHLSTVDQVHVIQEANKYDKILTDEQLDSDNLYKSIAKATKEWLYSLGSSQGLPVLAILLTQNLNLVEKMNDLCDPDKYATSAASFEPIDAGSIKFIMSMCNDYAEKTLLFDAMGAKTPKIDLMNELKSKEHQDVVFYNTVTKVYGYNPFPLMFILRLITWLGSVVPNHINHNVLEHLQLFMGQLVPDAFSSQLPTIVNKNAHNTSKKAEKAEKAEKTDENNHEHEHENTNTTIVTIGDKHKLALGKNIDLWPDKDEAIRAYTHFDNSLPFYRESTLKLPELWSLVEQYNYNDISSLQLIYNPFYATLLFPNLSLHTQQPYLLTQMLTSTGMLSNVYTRPNMITHNPHFDYSRNCKYPSTLMSNNAVGGTSCPKDFMWVFNQEDKHITGLIYIPSHIYKFVPRYCYNNPIPFPIQFPAIFTATIPTSLPLPPCSDRITSSLITETDTLQQQLAWTRHVFHAITANSLHENICLHLYIIHLYQVLLYQIQSAASSEAQALVLKTQISTAYHQLRNYIQKTGSLFAQLSAEDRPASTLASNLAIPSRAIPPPTGKIVEKLSLSTNPDFFASPQRRQQYLSTQLPIVSHSINQLCSTGLIWTLLVPNLEELFNSNIIPAVHPLSGSHFAQLTNIYSMMILIMFQMFALQAYIVEQQEHIIPPIPATSTPQSSHQLTLPYRHGTITEDIFKLSHAQQLTLTLTTYLCYLPPLAPNVFAPSPVAAFYRIADGLIEKLNYIVTTSSSPIRQCIAHITPLEYFCAILCYQELVYSEETLTPYMNSGGEIIQLEDDYDDDKPAAGTDEEQDKDKQIVKLAGATKTKTLQAGKHTHLFGPNELIDIKFDTSTYDPTLPPLPQISYPFLWLLYSSKVVERFSFKREHMSKSLELFFQYHYHYCLSTESAIQLIDKNNSLTPLPSTPELLYYIDCTITTYTHFFQSANQFTGLKQFCPSSYREIPTRKRIYDKNGELEIISSQYTEDYTKINASQFDTKPFILSADPEFALPAGTRDDVTEHLHSMALVGDSKQGATPPRQWSVSSPKFTQVASVSTSRVMDTVEQVEAYNESKYLHHDDQEGQKVQNQSTLVKDVQQLIPPYHSLGLLAFIIDCCTNPSIDDIISVIQGVRPAQKTVNLLKSKHESSDQYTTSESIDIDAMYDNFYIYNPFIDQLQRPIALPTRPYTYSKLNFSKHSFFSDHILFAGINPSYRTELFSYFERQLITRNPPQSENCVDYLHNNGLVEYHSTLGAEIFISAVLRQLPAIILTTLANSLGMDTVSTAISRPMYIIDVSSQQNVNFNIFDFFLAAQTNNIAPDLFQMAYNNAVSQ